MTTPENRTARRPHPRLVSHDIVLERHCRLDGRSEVVALVQCERRGTAVSVDACRSCERLAYIEPHEAGYVLLCRSTDEEVSAQALPESASQ